MVRCLRTCAALAFAMTSLTPRDAVPLNAPTRLVGYAPFTGRYRMSRAIQSVQLVRGEPRVTATSMEQRRSVTLAKNGRGLSVRMTLDSATVTSTSPSPVPDVSFAIGLTFVGEMSVDGKLLTSAVSDQAGQPSSTAFAATMESIFPHLRVGARRGAVWVDTTSSATDRNGQNTRTTTIATSTLGDTTIAGIRVWKITTTSTGQLSGRGNSPDGSYAISGAVSDTAIYVIDAHGVLIASAAANSMTMSYLVPMATLAVPITRKQTTRIEAIRP